MRFKDLDAHVRGWRNIELYICAGGDIGVCIADSYFGRGKTVKQALDMAFLNVKRRNEHES